MIDIPTNPVVIVLLILLALVALPYLGMRIALVESERRRTHQVSVDTRAADAQKAQEEKDRKMLDAIVSNNSILQSMLNSFSESSKAQMALFERMQSDHEAELGLRTKNSKMISEQGETLEVVSIIAAENKKNLELIQKVQGPTLQETHDMVADLQNKVAALPAEVQKTLQPLFDKMDSDIGQLKSKLDADILQLKTDMVKALSDIASKQAAAPSSITITNQASPAAPKSDEPIVPTPVTPESKP